MTDPHDPQRPDGQGVRRDRSPGQATTTRPARPAGTGPGTSARLAGRDRDRDPRSVREAVDDLAERASPTVREFSARAAELAADRRGPRRAAGPRAGDATADASGKLAAKSRSWAADLRASLATRRARATGRAAHRRADRPATPPPTAADASETTGDRPARSTARSVYSRHERPTHRPARRPAPAPQGPAGRQLRQVPPRAARRPAHTMRDAPGVGLAAPQLGEAAAGLRHRGRGPALRAGEPADRPRDRRRPRPRGLPVDPGLRRVRDPPREGLGRRPEPARQEDQGRRAPGSSAGRSSTSSTTSTASSTSTTSSRWTS